MPDKIEKFKNGLPIVDQSNQLPVPDQQVIENGFSAYGETIRVWSMLPFGSQVLFSVFIIIMTLIMAYSLKYYLDNHKQQKSHQAHQFQDRRSENRQSNNDIALELVQVLGKGIEGLKECINSLNVSITENATYTQVTLTALSDTIIKVTELVTRSADVSDKEYNNIKELIKAVADATASVGELAVNHANQLDDITKHLKNCCDVCDASINKSKDIPIVHTGPLDMNVGNGPMKTPASISAVSKRIRPRKAT